MSKRRKLLLASCAFVLLCILSCNNKGSRHHSPTDKKYHFALHLPAGTKYYYTITNETKTTAEANGKKINNNNQSQIGLIYEVLHSSSDTILLKITYDKLNISLNNNGREQQINASNATNTIDPVEKLLSTIRGKSIQITLTAKGDIVQVTGSKEIGDSILSTMNARDEYIKKTVREQLGKLVGDEFIKNNLQHEFKLFPDSAVYVGDSWTKNINQTNEIKSDALTTYTLTKVSGNTAEVEAESEMSSINTMTAMGSEVQTDLKGTQKGKFEADMATGLLMKGNSTISMEGTMQLMGREVPVEILISKHITSKKL